MKAILNVAFLAYLLLTLAFPRVAWPAPSPSPSATPFCHHCICATDPFGWMECHELPAPGATPSPVPTQ